MRFVLTHKYLYYPLLVFLLYFGLDKLFHNDTYKLYSQGDPTYLFYEYKEELMDELEAVNLRIHEGMDAVREAEDLPVELAKPATGAADPGGDIDPGEAGFPENIEPKIFLVLGSSRMLYFDYKTFDRSFPEWEMFNFSAPVTVPAYYLYILESAIRRGVKPDYVLIETAPFQFNASSDAFVKSNLGYSFSFPFLLRNFDLFENDEISYWLARNLFAGFKYPPHYGNIKSRWESVQEGTPNAFLTAAEILDEYQRTHRGAGKNVIPRDSWFERDFATLQYSAERTLRLWFQRYEISGRQFAFLKRLLELCAEHEIPVTMVRPPVARPLQRAMENREKLAPHIAEWSVRMGRLAEEHNASYLDLTNHPSYYCNTFVDASHMSVGCYQPMMLLAMQEYWRRAE